MLGGLPWGTPLKHWTTAMLDRALDEGHVDDSPLLAAAIHDELSTRAHSWPPMDKMDKTFMDRLKQRHERERELYERLAK
jgi:hypothetical protein